MGDNKIYITMELGLAETFRQGRVEQEVELGKETLIIVVPLKKVHVHDRFIGYRYLV